MKLNKKMLYLVGALVLVLALVLPGVAVAAESQALNKWSNYSGGTKQSQSYAYVDADGDGVCDYYGYGCAGQGQGQGQGQGYGYVDANNDGYCDNYTGGQQGGCCQGARGR